MEAVRTSETSVDNHFIRQYNPEDNSEHHTGEIPAIWRKVSLQSSVLNRITFFRQCLYFLMWSQVIVSKNLLVTEDVVGRGMWLHMLPWFCSKAIIVNPSVADLMLTTWVSVVPLFIASAVDSVGTTGNHYARSPLPQFLLKMKYLWISWRPFGQSGWDASGKWEKKKTNGPYGRCRYE
jgi:hypothetical protein